MGGNLHSQSLLPGCVSAQDRTHAQKLSPAPADTLDNLLGNVRLLIEHFPCKLFGETDYFSPVKLIVFYDSFSRL